MYKGTCVRVCVCVCLRAAWSVLIIHLPQTWLEGPGRDSSGYGNTLMASQRKQHIRLTYSHGSRE